MKNNDYSFKTESGNSLTSIEYSLCAMAVLQDSSSLTLVTALQDRFCCCPYCREETEMQHSLLI